MKLQSSALAIAALAMFTAPVHAFDCTKASTAVEKSICADPELKALDDDLSAAYADVKAASSKEEQKMLARSQKRWITSREYCTDSEDGLPKCIRDATEERLLLLKGEAESGPGPEGKLVPVFIVQEGAEKVYDLDIELLRFIDPETLGQKRFNAIGKDITKDVELGPHGQDTFGSIYAQSDSMSLAYASPDFISVRHSFYSNEGGAHGNGGTENFNIDMRSGKLLMASDLIDAKARMTLSTRCMEQLRTEKLKRMEGMDDYKLEEDIFLKDETVREYVGDLSRWSISEQTVTVGFDAYAIGAYAEGEYECVFPTADIKAMAKPGALLP